MFQRIKDSFHNLRRHKVMVLLIIALSFLCYQMFIRNYELQQPIVSKRAEKFMDVANERAACLTALEQAKADKLTAIQAVNQDLFQ